MEVEHSSHTAATRLTKETAKRVPTLLIPTSVRSLHLLDHRLPLHVRRQDLTFSDIFRTTGEWAYGATFQSYVSACIIVQQLAVCTVYVSFCGENLQAVLQYLHLPASHVQVMSMALPGILLLSFIPSLKQLAPIMAIGTTLLIISLACLGVIVRLQWEDRPDELPEMVLSKVPLALCAIIYSYEGICIILPVESAMKHPSQFGPVFIGTMGLVAVLYVMVGSISITTFGSVTSGSLTAFLLENFEEKDERITAWANMANTAVSLSVVLTYPLTIWPALELLSISVANSTSRFALCLRGGKQVEKDEDPLAAFEPLPPLPEDGVASIDDSIPEHHYGRDELSQDENEAASASGMSSSLVSALIPKLDMPGDSLQLRALLVLSTYFIAVVVPNVQALISLAGAVAGSSTALIIPPLVELAWIEHLEHCNQQAKSTYPGSAMPPTPSPHIIRTTMLRLQTKKQKIGRWKQGSYWKDKFKCYALLTFGSVFMAIGTYVSIADIVKIYKGVS